MQIEPEVVQPESQVLVIGGVVSSSDAAIINQCRKGGTKSW